MSRRRCSNSGVDLEALDIARGLYDSKKISGFPLPAIASTLKNSGFPLPAIASTLKNSLDVCTCPLKNSIPFSLATPKEFPAFQPSPLKNSITFYPATLKNSTVPQPGGAHIKCNSPFSAKARITTDKVGEKTASPPAARPPWRPFSGQATLNRPTPFLVKANRGGDGAFSDGGPGDSQEMPCVSTVYHDRQLPRSVSSLQEWLTEDIPHDWSAGYDPKHSFVLLPCIQSEDVDTDSLPCVPCVQQPDDWLIYTPIPEVKRYKPPKPRFRKFLEEGERNRADLNMNAVTNPSQIQISTRQGLLKHDIYEGKLRADIIRQEIEDLERLLQGIGNPKGSSIVVRYQHDINYLRDMVKTTLEGYEFPEEDRCLTPVAASLQEDLVKYPERHEQIIVSIKQRRDQCVKELADVEQDIMSTN